jgi:hypothetical protein
VQPVKLSKKKKQLKKKMLMKDKNNYMMNILSMMVGKYLEPSKIVKDINDHHLFKKLFK